MPNQSPQAAAWLRTLLSSDSVSVLQSWNGEWIATGKMVSGSWCRLLGGFASIWQHVRLHHGGNCGGLTPCMIMVEERNRRHQQRRSS
jgi:hypothetical protein